MRKVVKKIQIYTKNMFNRRDNKTWVFTEWFGKKCGDNSTFFANYIAKNYKDIKLFWICEKGVDTSLLDKSINIVEKDSEIAKNILSRASVIVMNQGLLEFTTNNFNYCANALKVNLWHGVMWKKLCLDSKEYKKPIKRLKYKINKLFEKKYLYESPSDEYTKVLKSAFAVKKRQIINAGQPRNSIFFDGNIIHEARKYIENIITTNNKINLNDLKIIAYMPTFRDKTSNIFNVEESKNINQIIQILEENNAVIIQKAHFISNERKALKINNKSNRIITNNDLISQYLLAAADILITDYSSCFFDYLLLDKPIIHYLYDYSYYSCKDRGLYYEYKDVACGDVAFNETELIKCIQKNLLDPQINHSLRIKRRKQYQQYESNDSCKIIAEEIFRRIKK